MGGVWYYRIVFEGKPLRLIDASSTKELAQKLFEYFRNMELEERANIEVDFPQRIIANLNMNERGNNDTALIPIGPDEARKILEEFVLFKGEVGRKARQDARKVQAGNDGEWPS